MTNVYELCFINKLALTCLALNNPTYGKKTDSYIAQLWDVTLMMYNMVSWSDQNQSSKIDCHNIKTIKSMLTGDRLDLTVIQDNSITFKVVICHQGLTA